MFSIYPFSKDSTFTMECLNKLLEKGLFLTSVELYENFFIPNDLHIDESIMTSINSMKKNIDNFHKLYT